MIAAEGVGLAANQIGVKKQIFVYRCPTDKGMQEGTIVNPRLILPSENERVLMDDMEGCLSIPGQHGLTPRYRTVIIMGVNLRGEPLPSVTASGFLARCFQHEIDHLNGLLYVDRLTRSARRDILEAYRYSAEKDEGTL
jgi:peptide deformylase